MTSRQEVHRTILDQQEVHLSRVREYLAQPSVSQEGQGMRECAQLVLRYLRELGCQEAELAETPRFPAVWGYYNAHARKTLAVYSYYDTNVVGSGWDYPAYDAVVAERLPFKQVVYGRGANSKGALMALLNGLQAIKTVEGELPVNLMFVIEGEEFLGSDHIPLLIERYRRHLAHADGMLWPGASQSANGDAALVLGNKGCLHIELECSGERWGHGPAGGPVHSSTQCVVEHPVWRLVHALSTLYDPAENRILVDGFYEGLREPTAEDLRLIDALAEYYKGRDTLGIPSLGPGKVTRFINDLSGRELFLRYCFQPTMNINGIRGGFTGPGTTLWTLPQAAYCTIDHRIPPDLAPEVCCQKIRSHLDRHGYSDIGIKVLMSVGAAKLSVTDDLAQAALRVYREPGIEPVVWPRRGASGPSGYFSQMVGLKVLTSPGLGHASGHSAGNEFLVVEGDGKVGGLVDLESSLADFVYSFAAYPDPF